MSTDSIFRVEKDYVCPSLKTIKRDNGRYNFIQNESDNRMKILSAGGPKARPKSGVLVNDTGDN